MSSLATGPEIGYHWIFFECFLVMVVIRFARFLGLCCMLGFPWVATFLAVGSVGYDQLCCKMFKCFNGRQISYLRIELAKRRNHKQRLMMRGRRRTGAIWKFCDLFVFDPLWNLLPFDRFCQFRLMCRLVDNSWKCSILAWMYCICSILVSFWRNAN